MKLLTLAVVSFTSMMFGGAAFADSVCDGPFVSQKYPVAHAVFVDTQTRCYSKWVVTAQSPEDVRCIFSYVDHKPTTKPDFQMTLSQQAFDDLIEAATTKGATNTSAYFGDRYVFIGFHSDLTPTDGTSGCK